MNPQTLGEHLRKRRVDLGLLQSGVAKRIGVDPATVTNWELGRTMPDLRLLPGILDFLGRDPRPLPPTLAGQIRHLRKTRGISTRELARQLRVDPSTVEKWERLGFNPHPRLYARLARFLDITEPARDAPFGERLRARRLALGLTQDEAGKLLGVCQDVVSQWELGRVDPENWVAIADALNWELRATSRTGLMKVRSPRKRTPK